MDRTLPRALRKKDDLNVLLTHVVECQVSTTGVTHEGLTWLGGPLEKIMTHPSYRPGMTVRVRFDEYDVSQAWVINPITLRDERLTPRLKKYMTGLSLHAHKCTLRNLAKPKDGRIDERALRAAKRKLDDQVEELMAGAKQMKNGQLSSGVAKFIGIGQKAPSGDDLAGIRAAESRFEETPEPASETRPSVDPSVAADDATTKVQASREPRTPRRVRNNE
jgi:hypothetical protein